jgi:phage head maturation protease
MSEDEKEIAAEVEVEEREDVVEPEEAPLYRQAASDRLVYRDEGEQVVEGMVVPLDEWSEVDSVIEGHFMERFAAGSLTKTFAEQVKRMKGYFEHGHSRLFGPMPIMDIRETWVTDTGGFFRADLLDEVPDMLKGGLRRGLYGASLGAKVIKMTRNRRPGKSDHNPEGIEERTYTEVRAFDISLTPRPHYPTALVALRSITDHLLIERLLEDPRRLLEVIAERSETTAEKETTEPQHSGREEQAEPAPQRSRSTQPSHDYLRPQEGARPWRL